MYLIMEKMSKMIYQENQKEQIGGMPAPCPPGPSVIVSYKIGSVDQ